MARQIIRVLNAIVRRGARTSFDVAECTGISLHKCSSYLTQLRRQGRIISTRQIKMDGNHKPYRWYEPPQGGVA